MTAKSKHMYHNSFLYSHDLLSCHEENCHGMGERVYRRNQEWIALILNATTQDTMFYIYSTMKLITNRKNNRKCKLTYILFYSTHKLYYTYAMLTIDSLDLLSSHKLYYLHTNNFPSFYNISKFSWAFHFPNLGYASF